MNKKLVPFNNRQSSPSGYVLDARNSKFPRLDVLKLLKLTLILQSFGLLRRKRQLVDVVLQNGRPLLQLVHDVPRRGHGHHQKDGRVLEIRLFQGELEEILVMRLAVQNPDAQSGVVCK